MSSPIAACRRAIARRTGSLRPMEPALIAFATTAATLTVTLVLALLEFRRRRRETGEARRAQIVGRVLDALENATRAAARAPIVGWWAPNELEYALLLPRLTAELPFADQAVGVWVARRLQHLRDATSRKAQVEIGADIAVHVVRWGHHEIDTSWFAEQLAADPWSPDFRPSTQSRWIRQLRDGMQLVPGTVVAMVGVLVIRDMLRRE